MGNTPKERLVETFTSALQHENANFVYVQVRMAEFAEMELIINPRENFASKLQYYDKVYDENLQLKANPSIQIMAYGWSETFEAIDYYVNDREQTVSLVFSMCAGELEGVDRVFKHESDAEKFVERERAKHPNFGGHQYVETYVVSQ